MSKFTYNIDNLSTLRYIYICGARERVSKNSDITTNISVKRQRE